MITEAYELQGQLAAGARAACFASTVTEAVAVADADGVRLISPTGKILGQRDYPCAGSPDRMQLAVSRQQLLLLIDGRIWAIDAGLAMWAELGAVPDCRDLSLADNGRWLAIVDSEGPAVVSLDTGQRTALDDPSLYPLTWRDPSWDQFTWNQIAIAPTVDCVVTTGELFADSLEDSWRFSYLAVWRPDGRIVAAEQLDDNDCDEVPIAFSPDGRQLAAGDDTPYVFSLALAREPGGIEDLATVSAYQTTALAYPSRGALFTGHVGGTINQHWLKNDDGSLVEPFADDDLIDNPEPLEGAHTADIAELHHHVQRPLLLSRCVDGQVWLWRHGQG